jgi:hypothetical protein
MQLRMIEKAHEQLLHRQHVPQLRTEEPEWMWSYPEGLEGQAKVQLNWWRKQVLVQPGELLKGRLSRNCLEQYRLS